MILTGKKHPQIKLHRFRKISKYEYELFGDWCIKSTLYTRFLNWNKIFERKKNSYLQNSVLCATSVLYSPFSLSSHWPLREQYCMEMLCFQSDYFQLKNGTPVFCKGFCVFQKICFKVKVPKTFKISSHYHIKTCRLLKWRAVLKIPSTFFWINLCWL